jgi:glutamate synthase (NADPH/NADH) small chain
MDDAQAPGGRLVNGLAGFKVDRAVIERRVQSLKANGVQFRMGMLCGRDVALRELRRGYDAVLFALGRTEPVPLEIPGSTLRGVCQAYPFILHHTTNGALQSRPVNVKDRRVVVLGGGDTAMDALRIALRAGAGDVVCIYRRDWEAMPADPKERENAAEEGARFLFLGQPVLVAGNAKGEVTGVRCVQMQLCPGVTSGRTGVRPVPGTEFEVPADVVLVAFGFMPPRLPEGAELSELARDPRGCLLVDDTRMTNLDGIFAAGSITRWPVSMVEVMRDSRQAAADIDRYLTARSVRG